VSDSTATTVVASAEEATAVEQYRAYVKEQVDQMVTSVGAFAAAVKSGDVNVGKAAYVAARPFYERIEPVAESFSDLDASIDGREDDAPSPDKFSGFHRIE
jgi:iron uptake system component EfeO